MDEISAVSQFPASHPAIAMLNAASQIAEDVLYSFDTQRLRDVAESFPLTMTIKSDHLPSKLGLSMLEQAFIFNHHRLLRTCHYIDNEIPRLDFEFCELKTRLRGHKATPVATQQAQMRENMLKYCLDIKHKTRKAWDALDTQLDRYHAERKTVRVTDARVALETYQAAKDVVAKQSVMRKRLEWLDNHTD